VLRGADIICLSSADWGRMWGTMQRVMDRLAQTNRVLYVEEPVTMLAPLKVPAYWRRWRAAAPQVKHLKPGLWTLTPPPLLPFGNMRPAVNRANQAVLARYVRWASHHLGFANDAIVWAYLPPSVDLLDALPAQGLVVYHCVDDHSAFPGFVTPEVVRAYEDELTRRADLVIATSERLASTRRPFNPRTYAVLNAADVDVFSRALGPHMAVPDDLARIPAPRLEIIGALDYRIDLKGLEALADADPAWQLVLIGPVNSGELERSSLRHRANVHLLGEKPYVELPGYLKGASVALIPYVHGKLTESIFPLKLFEYLAAGVPVVAGGLPELHSLSGTIGVAETAADYPALVREALTTDSPERRAARAAFAAGNSWDARVEDISRLVEEALERGAAISRAATSGSATPGRATR
jgi:glycosyltransferase involved in cell wall biosynthesis